MGRPKALLPWPTPEVPLARHVTNVLREAGLAPIGIVTGHHHPQIASIFTGSDIAVLFNARHDEGQLASMRAGLDWAFAAPGGEWALVTLVDVPAVRPDTIGRLVAHAHHTESLVIRPICQGKHGHPVLWRRAAARLLDQADPAAGGRAIVRSLAAAGRVLDVPVDDTGVLVDVDTPTEYEALLRDLRR